MDLNISCAYRQIGMVAPVSILCYILYQLLLASGWTANTEKYLQSGIDVLKKVVEAAQSLSEGGLAPFVCQTSRTSPLPPSS
jgi:hypothetical protein